MKNKAFIAYFCVFLFLYTLLDILAQQSYSQMIDHLGLMITLLHIGINIAISYMSALTAIIANPIRKTASRETAKSIPLISVIFGMFTFGCAPCIVGFLATIGISFIPPAFGGGNIMLKIVALIFVIIGYYITKQIVKKSTCKL